MPNPLISDVRTAHEHNARMEHCARLRSETDGMHEVALESGVGMADANIARIMRNSNLKKKRNSDRIGNNAPQRAYVLSDMIVTDMMTDRVVAVHRTTSRIVQRDDVGNVDAARTLAVASFVNHKRGTQKRGNNA